jgi:antitoxin component YwqK of YwqJK toxin-antitoxin module
LDNGQLSSEVNYINDKKEGIEKEYYENGQLKVEVNYINDINDIQQ